MTDTHTALLDRLALVFLVVFAAALPHSIAAAQIAAGLAALFWLIGSVVHRRRPELGGLGLPIALFVAVTVLSSVSSLEPAVSLDKLRSTSLILIVLVVAGTLKNLRQLTLVVVVLLVSGAATAAHTVWGVVAGRGVEVVALAPHGPLALAGVRERDVIVMCGPHLTDSPRELSAAFSVHISPEPLKCLAYVTGANLYEFQLPSASLPGALEGVGLRTGRTIRARGTLSHFTTYAEILMQLTAFTLGLWIANPKRWISRSGAALTVLLVLLAVALGATFTRASWVSLIGAALAMLWLRVGSPRTQALTGTELEASRGARVWVRGWKARIATGLFAIVLLLAMNQASITWRGVGFYNPEDLSMQYRRMMWTDGLGVIAQHPLLGVGMDTVLVRYRELGVRAYDAMGLHSHFHSTPIQFAVERGLLGLAAWVFLVFVYLRLLLRLIERIRGSGWWPQGLALGILGSATGFLASGFLHYNFGDSEIVMLFWLFMGLTAALDRLTLSTSAG